MARKRDDGKTLLVIPSPATAITREDPDPSTDVNILSKENLAEYQEQQLLQNAESLIPTAMKSMLSLVKKQDKKAIEMVMQMYNYLPRSSGISVITNIQQNNTTVSDNSGMYFEQIVRRLEQEQKAQAIDAEVVG